MISARYIIFAIYLIFVVQTYSRYAERIIGGRTTDIIKYPYLLGLFRNSSHFSCGATIISEYWALSAAHCYKNIANFSVHAGSSARDSGGTYHDVVEIIIHPDNNPVNENWDFAVIKVFPPFPIDNVTVASVQLSEEEPEIGEVLTVVGWGTAEEGGAAVPQLNSVDVNLISWDTCEEAYGVNLTSSMLCAASPGKDSCQGDSGGPMVNARGVQVGIVSWGEGCADPDYPGVYANVARGRNWIRLVTGV